MKHFIYSLLSIVIVFTHSVHIIAETQSISNSDANNSDDPHFNGWSEEQYLHYEDSILSLWFPTTTLHTVEKPSQTDISLPETNLYENNTFAVSNPYIPTSVSIDNSKAVGEIPIESGVSQTGARTYQVPINVPDGMRGFKPKLTLSYNSQQGNSIMGVGWTLSGLSTISRNGKNIYYDEKPDGIRLNTSDAFLLDGQRLIKTATATDHIKYESEQGNIQVKGYISGEVLKYFEVFFPEGIKGIYGYSSNATNKLYYPLVSMTDLHGNSIQYNYVSSGTHYKISSINYNGATIEFKYTSRKDPLLTYLGGQKISEPQLLNSITCKRGNTVIGTYTLDFSYNQFVSQLTKIEYNANGESYNPLKFYYGDGTIHGTMSIDSTKLTKYYNTKDPSSIKLTRGKFDYNHNSEGVIVWPNKNPYWKHHRNSGLFKHSQNRFDNKYDGDEEILTYAGLDGTWATPMPEILTEKGFVDILCADLEGKQEEFIIRINNSVKDNLDEVTFNVYRSSLYTGLTHRYSRSYSFSTVYKDADGGKSIQPKYYFPGDFNGDGKMEILAVSIHQPFGEKDKPSICYIFDLESDKIIYQQHIFPYTVEFLGTQQPDAIEAENKTDKLYVFDYDGDGKTDICYIDDNGTNIYTFDVNGNSLSHRKVATYTGLTKTDLQNCEVLLGEFNSDGLVDLLVTAQSEKPDDQPNRGQTWWQYNSKGNGLFEKTTFEGGSNPRISGYGYLLQDINGDGISDLVNYTPTNFRVSFFKNNGPNGGGPNNGFVYSNSIVIPIDINSHNLFSQMLCIRDGIVTKHSYSRNENLQANLTGMVNSNGVTEKNEYRFLNDQAYPSIYTTGYNAVFPYVNISERIAVLSSDETFMTGKSIDNNSYTYNNAVIHRQGLGFCGFEQMTTYDKRSETLVQTFDPFRFGILTKEVSPEVDCSYDYQISTTSNKITKILIANKNNRDLLTGVNSIESFSYDKYGYPTTERTLYLGENTTVTKQTSYDHNASVKDGYYLGAPIQQATETTRDGKTIVERTYIPSQSKRLPHVKVTYRNGEQTSYYSYTYDEHGNKLSESYSPYTSGDSLKTTYSYDTLGRLITQTDPLGNSETITYDNLGHISSRLVDYEGTTTYSYDGFGRETEVNYPDGTIKQTSYSWDSSMDDGLYSITESITGKPVKTITYDPLNREIRQSETALDGSNIFVDRTYDNFGNLKTVSIPFNSTSQKLTAVTYTYDKHNRKLSAAEVSGRVTTYSYSNNAVTTKVNNITAIRQYDCLGYLTSVTDNTGTISYNLTPDGQPLSVTAPGDVITEFGYDKSGRRVFMRDPSLGSTQWVYDDAGNIIREIDANLKEIKHEYNKFGHKTRTVTPEMEATFTYDSKGRLTAASTTNGLAKFYGYDNYGRLVHERESGDGFMFYKNYAYNNGNLSAILHESSTGFKCTETREYKNGHLSMVRLNGSPLLTIEKENVNQQPTEITTGNLTRYYGFDAIGLPVMRKAVHRNGQTFQDKTYRFIPQIPSPQAVNDDSNGYSEQFQYDQMERLVNYSSQRYAPVSIGYNETGNISSKSVIGNYGYEMAQRPYTLTSLDKTDDIPSFTQNVVYSSFSRPLSIEEGPHKATFLYNADFDRVGMKIQTNGVVTKSRNYYLGCYEIDKEGSQVKEKIYLGGDYYKASMVLVRESGTTTLCHILRDYMGNITSVVTDQGEKLEELSYDPWGRLRDPKTLKNYLPGEQPSLFLGRGYSGHEHLPEFGLINMNARLYDPVIGMFLSPDPYIQMPENSLNFNRYSYALNNPLKYNDPNGEIIGTILTAIEESFINLWQHGFNVSQYNWRMTLNAWRIDMGMYKGNLMQIYNKFIHGFFNSFVGTFLAHIYNINGVIDQVTDLDGMLALSGVTTGSKAFTIGHLSFGPDGYTATWKDHLFVHEYGHYIQSQWLGNFYLPTIGKSSLLSAWVTSKWANVPHSHRWFEVNASKLGANHFDKKYGTGKGDYTVGSVDHFDKNSFINDNSLSPYINPRTFRNNSDSHRISSPTITIWDFIL